MFAYDAERPLDLAVHRVQGRVSEISYVSPMGGRVPGSLVMPEGRGPFAALVYMHPGQGDRSTFLDEALSLAPAGVLSLLIDSPFHRGEPRWNQPYAHAMLYRQLVVDVRRGLDLLTARHDVDSHRLGYVGHSLGATWGGPLAGVERRLRAVVLMAGYPRLTQWHRESRHPLAVSMRQQMTGEQLEAYLAPLSPLDAVHYIGQAAPASLLFQFGTGDEFVTRAEAEAYFAAASEPKQVRWYESDHHFSTAPHARQDRVRWLGERLGFEPFDACEQPALDLK